MSETALKDETRLAGTLRLPELEPPQPGPTGGRADALEEPAGQRVVRGGLQAPLAAGCKRPSACRYGRKPREVTPLTPAEAAREAAELARNWPSNMVKEVVRLLYCFGALTGGQLHRLCRRSLLGVSPRHASFMKTVWTYRVRQLVSLLPDVTDSVVAAGLRAPGGDDGRSVWAFTLGPVGARLVPYLVEAEAEVLPENPYEGSGMERLVHDLLCNEVLLQLAENVPGSDIREARQLVVYAAYEETPRQVVCPDGAWSPKAGKWWLLEYCNRKWPDESDVRKIEHYDDLGSAIHGNVWTAVWGSRDDNGAPVMPGLLLVFRYPTALAHYERVLALRERQVNYAALMLPDVLAGRGLETLRLLAGPQWRDVQEAPGG